MLSTPTIRTYPSIKKVNIFDLDGTVINSFHRVKPHLSSNGDLDLKGYMKEATTHAKIMADDLLPLVTYMKDSLQKDDTHNVIVTARMMTKSDNFYLRKQKLLTTKPQAVRLMSRDRLARFFNLDEIKARYYSRDAEYKRGYFELIQQMYPSATITVFDDHQGVLNVAREMGFNAIDAIVLNDIIQIACTMTGESFIDDLLSESCDPEYLGQEVSKQWHSMLEDEKQTFLANIPRFN